MLDRAAYCELSFSPNLNLISTVRRFVAEFYERILGDARMTSRLVVSTHELLENAVRYSVDGQSTIRISVEAAEPSTAEVSIETRNRTTPEAIATLRNLLAEMHAAPERDAFYQTLLRRNALRDDGSGLGLGRIFAESEMDLSCEFESDLVRLRAVAHFPLKEIQG